MIAEGTKPEKHGTPNNLLHVKKYQWLGEFLMKLIAN